MYLVSEAPKWYGDALTTLWRHNTIHTLTTYMPHYTHSGVYNNPMLPDAHTHSHPCTHTGSCTQANVCARSRTHTNTLSVTSVMWWEVSGKRLQTFKPHLLFTLQPFGARLQKRTLIYFAWQVWIFCETHLENWRGEKKNITARSLFKRYRFSAQALSFCHVRGSEVARGDVVDTPM